MDNLVSETNAKLESVIENLETIKKEYEKKLKANDKEINAELSKVRKYKKDFQLVKDINNPNRFWIETKDEDDLYCVVKPKEGYDIVIAIEKGKEMYWISNI